MKRPDNINYGSSEWRAICHALEEMTRELDVVNRNITLDHETTTLNRAMQAAYATIIGWGQEPAGQEQKPPVYAVHQGGYDDFPLGSHPDDQPVN